MYNKNTKLPERGPEQKTEARKGWGIMKKTYGRGILTAAAAACLAACFALSAGAEEGNRWDYTTGKDSQGNVTIQFSEVSLTLPASWAGNCAMSIGGDSVNFFHIDSRDLWTQELGYSNGGSLFTLCYTQTLDYLDLPSYETLGNGEDGIYYVALPTDVQGYYENEEVMAEFTSMSNDVSWVLDHILINGVPASGIAAEAAGSGDYILPQSSTEYLDESDLSGMTANQVQMAINEIYARHGRMFNDQDIQDYFNRQDWYVAQTASADFDDSVLNEVELYNVELIHSYELQQGY